MKRNKLGATSAIIGMIVGCLLFLVGIGVISIGYTDGWGLWTKYIEPNEQVATIELNEDVAGAAISGNGYAVATANGAIALWNMIPHTYKPGTLGGVFALLGVAFFLVGLFCYLKNNKKLFLAFAIVDTVIFAAFGVAAVLLGIGGCELAILLYCIGGVVLFGATFPAFKYCGFAMNAGSAKKGKKKLSRKQKKIALIKATMTAEKKISKPISVNKLINH